MALTDSLISFWEMEESSGTRNDSHSTNHLTDTSSVSPVVSGTGIVGNGVDLERGEAEYLIRTSNASLSVTTGDSFTFALWVKAETFDALCGIIAKATSVPVHEYRLFYWASADRFVWRVGTGGSGETSVSANTLGTPSSATWYFIVAYADNTANEIGIRVGVGGTLGAADTTSWTTEPVNASGSFAIGRLQDTNADWWDGLIDQVGFWKRVLTSGEMTTLYNGGAGLSYAAILASGGATVTPTVGALALTGTGTVIGKAILMPSEP